MIQKPLILSAVFAFLSGSRKMREFLERPYSRRLHRHLHTGNSKWDDEDIVPYDYRIAVAVCRP